MNSEINKLSFGKKLLILGIDTSTRYVLDYCRRRGIYTIITDFQNPDEAPLKLAADEYRMINVADTEALVELCRQERINHVFAGNHEFCLDQAKGLSERCGMPFYASTDGWKATRDKHFFKKKCSMHGILVPKTYTENACFDEEKRQKIIFPVIVKPCDGSSMKGLSVCKDDDELLEGIRKAKAYSDQPLVIEEFVDGFEIGVHYYVDHGEPHLMCMNDLYKIDIDGEMKFSLIPNTSIWAEKFLAEESGKVTALLQDLGCRDGALYFQIMVKNGKFYYLEMGDRLDGIAAWVPVERKTGFNYLERMVDLAMGIRSKISWQKYQAGENAIASFTYCIWVRPGIIEKIEGEDEVIARTGADFALKRFKQRDVIKATGNMLQMAYYLNVSADSSEQLAEKLSYINRTLQITDKEGKNLLIFCHEEETLKQKY